MDEPNFYESTSGEGRRVIEEADDEPDKPMEEEDDATKQRRIDRCNRRAERQGEGLCRCGRRSRSRRRRRRRKLIMSQNPFIIFYLEMYAKNPGKRVTEVAREAGKEWCAMAEEDRQKYIRLAERERKRRRRQKGL